MTKDMRTVTVGALVTYEVDDAIKAMVTIADLPSDIMERSQAAIFAVVCESTMEQIQSERLQFNTRLTEKVSQLLNGYGVHILQAQITEFAPCRAIAINAHTAVGNYTLWTGF
jgi:regulator of protease activity HflC (stomatin/prohibitin superfamily)